MLALWRENATIVSRATATTAVSRTAATTFIGCFLLWYNFIRFDRKVGGPLGDPPIVVSEDHRESQGPGAARVSERSRAAGGVLRLLGKQRACRGPGAVQRRRARRASPGADDRGGPGAQHLAEPVHRWRSRRA